MKKIEIIALIDDDPAFVFITEKIIEKTNHFKEVKVFDNGLYALNYLKENLNNDTHLPNIIFLDLSMPVMDGWQFLDEYALLEIKNKSKITVYICSSSISPYDITRAKSISDVTDFIIKPITKEKLTEIVSAF
ncbi:response regulator [Flavobacterium sp. N2820]|uniref:response regulator n=1 Tax=Flavobacterium sp. N2820 TaxID=2986834 RepID=UPI002225A3CD|nr:response regulator [Flavobacterium sp. N2820]